MISGGWECVYYVCVCVKMAFNPCISYVSTSVIQQQDQGNLLRKSISLDLWFQRVTVHEDWAKAWWQEAGKAESSPLQPKAGGRGHTVNGMSFGTSKPVLCDTPLTRPPCLIFPNSFTNWRWRIQTHEATGAILTQTTSACL